MRDKDPRQPIRFQVCIQEPMGEHICLERREPYILIYRIDRIYSTAWYASPYITPCVIRILPEFSCLGIYVTVWGLHTSIFGT